MDQLILNEEEATLVLAWFPKLLFLLVVITIYFVIFDMLFD